MDEKTYNEEKFEVIVDSIVDELHDCAVELANAVTPDQLYIYYTDIKNICARLYMFSYKHIFED